MDGIVPTLRGGCITSGISTKYRVNHLPSNRSFLLHETYFQFLVLFRCVLAKLCNKLSARSPTLSCSPPPSKSVQKSTSGDCRNHNDKFCTPIFRCVLASLHVSRSVSKSVSWSVGWMVSQAPFIKT